MPIDFPNSPTAGDTYTVGTKTWQYDGTSWNVVIGDTMIAVGSVTAEKIADGAITNAKVGAAAAIALSKLASSTTAALGVGTIELGHASDTTIARGSAGVVTVEGVNLVTASSTDTLTNKTINLTSNTLSATSAQLATAVSDETGSGSLVFGSSPTLTSPTINGSHTNLTKELIVQGLEERINVVASAATGTINVDVATSSIWYYTSNATANHTLNFRYNSGTSLSSKLAVDDSITVVWMNTNGATPYYPNVVQIDGSTVTPKVPSAITGGNASSIDVYSFTIVKTAATPTYVVLETQTKFA